MELIVIKMYHKAGKKFLFMEEKMEQKNNTKLCSILSYFSWIGWIISFAIRDKDDEVVKFHLNQGLVLNLASLVLTVVSRFGGVVAIVASVASLAVFVFAILGIVRAAQDSTQPLPLIGDIKILK